MSIMLRPGARIDAAIEVFRAEAMQAVADAAMQIKQTSRLSMRKMIVDERVALQPRQMPTGTEEEDVDGRNHKMGRRCP